MENYLSDARRRSAAVIFSGRRIFVALAKMAESSPSSIMDEVQEVAPREPKLFYNGGDSSGGIKCLVIAIVVVLVLILLFYLLSPSKRRHHHHRAHFASGGRGGLSDKLAKRGWILYTRQGCGFCIRQLEELGTKHYPMTVDCMKGGNLKSSDVATPPLSCGQVGGFPTWYNTSTKETKKGLQKRDALEAMAK